MNNYTNNDINNMFNNIKNKEDLDDTINTLGSKKSPYGDVLSEEETLDLFKALSNGEIEETDLKSYDDPDRVLSQYEIDDIVNELLNIKRSSNNEEELNESLKDFINDRYIKERAKMFAVKAHKDQVRKSEPDKPKIIHPISVAKILEEYGCDDHVIAAGYLHDVVEDTKYTLDDIENEFGSDIKDLVDMASEPDKSLSWEERKTHTINNTKNLSLRKKLVIAADKINNLEDLNLLFKKSGRKDFSNFNRGEDKQKWYYTSIYESLIYNEDENLPIFKRLKGAIDSVFTKETLKHIDIFKDDVSYYKELLRLDAKKKDLYRLKELINTNKPYVIEFTGTPRTGKTSIINNMYDFFKKGGFKVEIINEYDREALKRKRELMNINKDINLDIIDEVAHSLSSSCRDNCDIILADRSINDRLIWNYRALLKENITEDEYKQYLEKYSKESKKLINFLVITYANSLVSLQRDYRNSLALEDRSFLNIENIQLYNNCLIEMQNILEKNVEECIVRDTNNSSNRIDAINITDIALDAMQKHYIKIFKKNNNL